ncbi:MAG: aldose 1-epimerase family protein [Candidatus Velthaea sp.]|jgi:galactose mutarotase-like enzyme
MDEFHFAGDQLAVTVKAQGAELRSLVHARFGEMLWQAGPIWPQHAPNLFPIVGQLAGDTYRYGGATYELPRHGFARRQRFTWIACSAGGCELELHDDAQTQAAYPFAFRLTIAYAVAGDTLSVTYRVRNTGDDVLPASVGAHPAFRWPLAAGIAKAAHTLTFAQPEPEPIRRLDDGLLKSETFATPIVGRTLQLDESLFDADAIILDRPASTSVRYTAPGAPLIDVEWERFRELGVWSKRGGDFLCIEPWYGYASPVGFDGSFERKPGLLLIAPGETEVLTLRIRIGE